MSTSNQDTQIAKAIGAAFFSPNEMDSNMESANVVDGLYALMRAMRFLAEALGTVERDEQYGTFTSVTSVATAISTSGEQIAAALNNVAAAVRMCAPGGEHDV